MPAVALASQGWSESDDFGPPHFFSSAKEPLSRSCVGFTCSVVLFFIGSKFVKRPNAPAAARARAALGAYEGSEWNQDQA